MFDGKAVLIICMSFTGSGVTFLRYNAHLVICQISNCKMRTIVSYSLLSIYVSDIMLKSSTLPLMTLFAGF